MWCSLFCNLVASWEHRSLLWPINLNSRICLCKLSSKEINSLLHIWPGAGHQRKTLCKLRLVHVEFVHRYDSLPIGDPKPPRPCVNSFNRRKTKVSLWVEVIIFRKNLTTVSNKVTETQVVFRIKYVYKCPISLAKSS